MAKSPLDFAFDERVSETYDKVRAHPSAASSQIGTAIAEIAGAEALVLELGVGTGRIALPVVGSGCAVVGVDLSDHMLRHVMASAAKLGGPFAAVRADVAQLPFAEQVFDAVTAVHVLHLVPDWKSALTGSVRALRPGGHLILGRDWVDPESIAGQIQTVFRKTVIEILGPQLKAPTSATEMADHVKATGADPIYLGPTDRIAAEWETDDSPIAIIESIRTRVFPESWILPEDLLNTVAERVQEHAKSTQFNLDETRPVTRRFLLSVFRRQP